MSTLAWKAHAERLLMAPDSPGVLTTAMLHAFTTAGRADVPSRATFSRWVARLCATGRLQEVVRGVYLNRQAHADLSPAAAAHWVRHRSVVSLAWVLEQAHVTNNFGDTITCVIPIAPGWPNPQVGDRRTKAGTFRFFAMPADRVESPVMRPEDRLDLRFDYPRTTPEKALMDWLYLGASRRSRMTPPPLDLDVSLLDRRRLRRLARAMGLESLADDWLARQAAYQASDEVRENSAPRLVL